MMRSMIAFFVGVMLMTSVAMAGEPHAAGTPASDGLRPLPAWVKELYEKDFVGYKFQLPPTVRKEHPRLPHPSAKLVKLARENLPAVLKANPRCAEDPAVMYLLTGDKKHFDKAVAYLKTDNNIYAAGRYFHTLDYIYNELPEDVRTVAVARSAEFARKWLSWANGEPSPLITQDLNRVGFYGQMGAIVVWGHAPDGDELLKRAHQWFFQVYMPDWHLAMGPDGGTIPWPTDPFYGGIGQKIIPWGIEMWSSFLGVNLFKENPWMETYIYQPYDFALPNLCGVPYGDCPRQGDFAFPAGQCDILAERYDNPYFGGDRKSSCPLFVPSSGHQFWAELDFAGKKAKRNRTELPTERFYQGWGAVTMRSDWTENGTFAMFRIGDVVSNHNHADSGHFFIYRNGTLASDKGWVDFHMKHYFCYTALSVAHNVVTVRDPADKFVPNEGGQRAVAAQMGLYGQPGGSGIGDMVWGRPKEVRQELVVRPGFKGYAGRQGWETGDMLAYDPSEEYVYAAGDVTAAYQNAMSGSGGTHHRTKRLKVITRAFLYIRPDYFAVFDRVDALKPDFEKKWLLQMAMEPKIEGDTVMVERNDLIKSTYPMMINEVKRKSGADLLRYQNHGEMFCKTLLPKDFKIEKIGGPGKDFWVDGKNYGEGVNGTAPCPQDVGGWRIEVSPKEGRTLDCFLHVMQVGDSKALDKMVPVEYQEKGEQVGFKMQANGGVYTVFFDKSDGIGGHITFEKDGTKVIDRDFAEELKPNRTPAALTSKENSK